MKFYVLLGFLISWAGLGVGAYGCLERPGPVLLICVGLEAGIAIVTAALVVKLILEEERQRRLRKAKEEIRRSLASGRAVVVPPEAGRG